MKACTCPFNYPEIGEKESYMLYHEEMESLVKNLPRAEEDAVLDDIRPALPDTSPRTAECGHDDGSIRLSMRVTTSYPSSS